MPEIMQRTLTGKLYPSQTQSKLLHGFHFTAWILRNYFITQRRFHYQNNKTKITRNQQINYLPRLRKIFPELKEAPAQLLQQVAMQVDDAYQRFFTGQGKYPKTRKYQDFKSINFPQHGNSFEFRQGKLYLSKLGTIRIKYGAPTWLTTDAQPKQCRIVKEPDGWHFRITYEIPTANLTKPITTGPIVGGDFGVRRLLTLSNGKIIPNPNHTQRHEKRLRLLQRRLSRSRKGGANRKKLVKKVARLHLKIRNQRLDHRHKISRMLAETYPTIILENNLGNLRGNMAKHNLDAGWGMTRRLLDYKIQEHDGQILGVPAAYTSMTCNQCLFILPKKFSSEQFTCPKCKYTAHRDDNAAKNIHREGLTQLVSYALPTASGKNTPRKKPRKTRSNLLDESQVNARGTGGVHTENTSTLREGI